MLNYLEIFYIGDLFILLHLLIHSIVYLCKYRYLFYTLSYNPELLCYFVAQIMPPLATGRSVSRLLCPSDIPQHSGVFQHFLTFWHCKILQASSCRLCGPVLESAISLRSPHFFLKNDIRNQDLGPRGICFTYLLLDFTRGTYKRTCLEGIEINDGRVTENFPLHFYSSIEKLR